METAILFVMQFYQVSREDVVKYYWDEVESYLRLQEHFGVEESRREKFRKSFEEAFKGGVDLSGRETP
jgi:hypothetical protein